MLNKVNLLCTQDTITLRPELKVLLGELVVHTRYSYSGAGT